MYFVADVVCQESSTKNIQFAVKMAIKESPYFVFSDFRLELLNSTYTF